MFTVDLYGNRGLDSHRWNLDNPRDVDGKSTSKHQAESGNFFYLLLTFINQLELETFTSVYMHTGALHTEFTLREVPKDLESPELLKKAKAIYTTDPNTKSQSCVHA